MPPLFVTATVTAPALPAGVVAVIVVVFVTEKLAAFTPPKVTAEMLVKPVPVIVTLVPPAAGPEAGETLVTVGAAASAGAGLAPSARQTTTSAARRRWAPHATSCIPCRRGDRTYGRLRERARTTTKPVVTITNAPPRAPSAMTSGEMPPRAVPAGAVLTAAAAVA